MFHKTVCLLFLFFVVSCTTQQTITPIKAETHTIDQVYNSCSYYTTVDGCKELEGQDITIQGVFYFPDWDDYHPRLYPLGTKISLIDSDFDNLSGSNDWKSLPESFDLWVSRSSKSYRKKIQKLHGYDVTVTGRAETDCALVNTETGGGGVDEDGNIWWIGGYCHTQTNVYMKDFDIVRLN